MTCYTLKIAMNKQEIIQCLRELDQELSRLEVKGEVCLYGGAVLCMVFEARPSTKDVDAIFHPADVIRKAADKVAQAHDLPMDWLNDAVKGFVVPHKTRSFLDLPNLKVYVPEPDYLLAMKTLSARVEGPDQIDVRRLIQELDLKTPEDVFKIVEKYYPKERIKPATQFFIEEIFEE